MISINRQLTNAIQNYKGIDPLAPWVNYIDFLEQYDSNDLRVVLTNCLSHFEVDRDHDYSQDERMLSIHLKYVRTFVECTLKTKVSSFNFRARFNLNMSMKPTNGITM